MRKQVVVLSISACLMMSGLFVPHSRVSAWPITTTRAIVLSGFSGEESGAQDSTVTVDRDDNLIVRSRTAGTIQINPANASSVIGNGRDWQEYISKFSTKGELLWNAIWLSATGDLWLNSHDVAPNGDIYVSGYATGGFDVDPGSGTTLVSGTSSDQRAVVICLDTNGQFKWFREFSSTSSVDVSFVKVLPNNSLAVTGNFDGTVNFDGPGGIAAPTYTSTRGDVFVAVLDSTGVEQWITRASGPDTDYPHALQVSSDGSIFVVGGYSDASTNFYSTSGSSLALPAISGIFGTFVWKISGSGNTEWVVSLSEASGLVNQLPTAFLLRSNGSMLVSTEKLDIFALNGSGFITSRLVAGTRISQITEVDNGAVLLSGWYTNTKDLDPTSGVDNRTSPHGSNSDGFITRLRSDLSYESSTVLNLASPGRISSVFTAASGQWGISGVAQPGTLTFALPSDGSSYSSSAGADSMLFVVRYNADGTTVPPVPSAPTTSPYTAGNKKAIVRWGSTLHAARYEVLTTSGRVVCNTTSTSCAISGLKNGKLYTYLVKAYNYNEVSSDASTVRVISGFTLGTREFKVNKKPLLRTIITTPSKGTKKYRVLSGSCKIVGTRLVTPSRRGSCKLSLSVAKKGSYPAMSTTVTVSYSR